MSTGSAKRLVSSLKRTPAKSEEITDEGTQEILRAMQARGIIGDVPGLPKPADVAAAEQEAAYRARLDEVIAALSPPKVEPEEETPAPLTAAQLLAQAIAGAGSDAPPHLPLNGAQLLQRALAGGPGTINGEAAS
jgi:hypothetical protein